MRGYGKKGDFSLFALHVFLEVRQRKGVQVEGVL